MPEVNVETARRFVLEALRLEFAAFDRDSIDEGAFTHAGVAEPVGHDGPSTHALAWTLRLRAGDGDYRGLDTRGRRVEIAGWSSLPTLLDHEPTAADVTTAYDVSFVATQLGLPMQGRQVAV